MKSPENLPSSQNNPTPTPQTPLSHLPKTEIERLLNEGRRALISEFRLDQKPQTLTSGPTGIKNLGNTCFMAAVLQCLSSCQRLTLHFLNSNFEDSINVPGSRTRGRLACAYFRLLKRLWGAERAPADPGEIRDCVAGVCAAFAGGAQQDAQEFLALFLDFLHEDLNKVAIKPYRLLGKFGGGAVEEFAGEVFKAHLRRNRSVIVEVFHGQFYSRIKCPDCGFVSAAFDPFDMVSVNIPLRNSVPVDGYFLPLGHGEAMGEFSFYCPEAAPLSELIDFICLKLEGVRPEFIRPMFYLNAKIAKRLNFPFSSKAQRVLEKSKGVLVLGQVFDPFIMGLVFEERAERALVQLRSRVDFVVRVQIFDGGQILGVEREVVVPELTTSMDLHLLVFCIFRGAFVSAGIKGADLRKFSAMENRKQLLAEFGLFFPERFIDPARALFSILVNQKELVNLDDKTSLFKFTFENLIRADVRIDPRKFSRALKLKKSAKLDLGNFQASENPLTLLDCFQQFTSEEQLSPENAWICDFCKNPKQAFKRIFFIRLPEILIVHLKRFKKQTFKNGSVEFTKVGNLVEFPLNGFEVGNFLFGGSKEAKYELFAVANHYGSCGGGHYTAFCKNFIKGEWFCFDDEKVKKIEESEIVSSAAYVLFYRREQKIKFEEEVKYLF